MTMQQDRKVEKDRKARSQQGKDDLPPPQQQAELNPKQMPKDMQQRGGNPGQTGTPGGKGKQDAPQNQKR